MRAPRSSLSKSTGQGVSRKAYQTAYSLTHDSGSRLPAVSIDQADAAKVGGSGRNQYAKDPGVRPGYGDTPGLPKDIADVEALGKTKVPKGLGLKPVRARKLK
jgi:hypothetical protein